MPVSLHSFHYIFSDIFHSSAVQGDKGDMGVIGPPGKKGEQVSLQSGLLQADVVYMYRHCNAHHCSVFCLSMLFILTSGNAHARLSSCMCVHILPIFVLSLCGTCLPSRLAGSTRPRRSNR